MGLPAVANEPRQITLVSQAKTALAEARSLDEVKDIRDKAEAMRLYLKQRDESLEAQNTAAEIKLWAERKAGELLKAMPKHPGGRPLENHRHDDGSFTPTLADIGVDENQSRRWQTVASLPEDEFTRHIEETKAAGKDLTTNGVLKVAKDRTIEQRKEEKKEEMKARAEAVPDSPDWEIDEGDCLYILQARPSGIARLVFADPPYNIGIDYGNGSSEDLLPGQDYLGWCYGWISECARMLTQDGSLWVLINHEWASDFEAIIREVGLRVRSWITWYETFGVNCSNNFNRTSRRILYAVKDPTRFVFHAEAVSRPSDRQLKYNDPRANPDGKLWDDVWGINPPIPRLAGTHTERIPDFPTQLPLSLLMPIVGCASDPGDLVLDPFNGSGTTGAASIRLGRRYLGVEKSSHFAELSRLRLKGEKRGTG
jgi:DNA modification methylase